MKKRKILKTAVISAAVITALYGAVFGIDIVRFMISGDEHIKPVLCLGSYSCKCGETKWDDGIFYDFCYYYEPETYENSEVQMQLKYFEFFGVTLYKKNF